MTVEQTIPFEEGTFFITSTCHKWMNLIETTNVEAKRKANKQHEVWELSFDWKYCNSYKFIKQKLDYMHNNPCTGKWNLCENPIDLHSSAKILCG